MAQREAYVPPVRQSSPGPADNSNSQSGGTSNSQNDAANNSQNGDTITASCASTHRVGQPEQPQQPEAAAPRVSDRRKAYDTPDKKMYYLCAAYVPKFESPFPYFSCLES